MYKIISRLLLLVSLSMLLGGCFTFYGNSRTQRERIITRYRQHVIQPEDGFWLSALKFSRHLLVDVSSLFIAEAWYARVRRTYGRRDLYDKKDTPPPTPPVANTPPSCRIVALEYDDRTRCGRISVESVDGRFELARQYARNYIEAMARDKNVALVTGERPNAATFMLKGERIENARVLVVDFETL